MKNKDQISVGNPSPCANQPAAPGSDGKLPLLLTRGLQVGYASCAIAGPLNLEIRAGQLICLLGPNGSGKSTLLRTLAGLIPALRGDTLISGAALNDLNPARLAKKISLVLTDPVRNSNLTAYSLVALGRYPYSNWLGSLNEKDRSVIAWAIETAGIGSFVNRKLSTLSDGESQKAMLARALAQDTPLMMLDEPTAHLDLPSRIQLMQLLHQLAKRSNKGILISTHELDLALQVADETWLLQSKGQFHSGTPEDLVLNGIFGAAFEKEGVRFDRATGAFTMHQESGRQITLTGEGAAAAAFWTKRALTRHGFTVTDPISSFGSPALGSPVSGSPTPSVHVSEAGGRTDWTLEYRNERSTHGTIAALLEALDTIGSPAADAAADSKAADNAAGKRKDADIE